MPGSFRLVVLVGLLGAACARPPTQRSVVLPVSAEALSLLGDTLWSLPVAPAEGPRLVDQLNKARHKLTATPFDANASLVVARRTADLGRLREAVMLYTQAAELHPTDVRVQRYRGEILLQLRELELAQHDFQDAATRLIGQPTQVEFLEVEDGGLLGSTLQFNILYLLGLTYYVRGDFAHARMTLLEAARSASTGDDLVAAGLWLFFTSRRLGAMEESRQILVRLTDSAAVSARNAELTLLAAFRRGASSDSLHLDFARAPNSLREALTEYGFGFALLQLGRREEAELVFEQVRQYADWSALPVLAAESELARLRREGRK